MTDPTAALRMSFYLLLTAVAVAIGTAKVAGIDSVFEPTRYAPPDAAGFGADRVDVPTKPWPASRPEPWPMFGSNDKSRLATVRALVDQGTFVIGHRGRRDDPRTDTGLMFEDGWFGRDHVMNPVTGDYYSSKPPLFAVLLAGEYWVLKHAFGLSIVADRWPVILILVFTANVIPFAVMLVLLGRLIEQYGITDFGRLFAFSVACFATFLTTFSNTINNHTPAACCVVFALYPLLQTSTPSRLRLFTSGFFAAMAITFDMPAASFAAAVGLLTLLNHKLKVAYMVLGAVVPMVAFFAANYAALGSFRPAYSEFGGPWYNYPGSHWGKLEQAAKILNTDRIARGGPFFPGIDFTHESRGVYLFHCLLGHHGWFSLTPVWFVGLLGIARMMGPAVTDVRRRVVALPMVCVLTLVLTLTLTVFFVFIQKTNNYGGGTSGLRWFFWLTPLWVLATLAGADRLRSRIAHGLCAVLLGISVISVFYPSMSPWRHPCLQVGDRQLRSYTLRSERFIAAAGRRRGSGGSGLRA
jgi:hypothetical protein